MEIFENWIIGDIFYIYLMKFSLRIFGSLGGPCTFVGWKLYKRTTIVTYLVFALIEEKIHHVLDMCPPSYTLVGFTPCEREDLRTWCMIYLLLLEGVTQRIGTFFVLFLFSVIVQQARNWYMLLSFVFFMTNTSLLLLFYI